jgi:hypothetical protein
MVWKQMVGEEMDAADLAGFDALAARSLARLRNIEADGVDEDTFSSVIFETHVAMLSDGTEAPLCPGGASLEVTWDNRAAFSDSTLQARLYESQAQCDAMLQGLAYLVPQRVLALFTGAQLERLVCGDADIDLELLRSKTKYGMGTSPNHRHIRYLWAALKKFSPAQRSLFLRFVWGRTRLPTSAREWGNSKLTLHTRHCAHPDGTLPIAHTCFFSLELPIYSSLAICHEKLLYAVTHGIQIDMDTTTNARESRGLLQEERASEQDGEESD